MSPPPPILRFYDDLLSDYQAWSKNLNIHFGYFSWDKIFDIFNLEKMLENLNVQVGLRLNISHKKHPALLLDAGCGTGATSLFFAKQFEHIHFKGINLSPKQIAYGRQLVEFEQLSSRIDLSVGNFTSTSFGKSIFDGAFAIESACYSQGKAKLDFLIEMARVLRSGGRLVVVDGFTRKGTTMPPWISRLHLNNLRLWHIDEMAGEAEFKAALGQAGFKEVHIEDISWRMAPSAIYLPITGIKLILNRLFSWKKPLSASQRNYRKALFLTFFLGLFQRYFGYFIITAVRA